MSSVSNIRSSAFMGALGFFLALALAFFGFPTRPLTVACFWGVSACELLLDDLVATMAACRRAMCLPQYQDVANGCFKVL